MNWPWEELGLSGPAPLSAIRRAYAERLKVTRPEENPEGFQRLRNAYQAARRMARKETDDVPERDGAKGEASFQNDAERETLFKSDGGTDAEIHEPPERTWDFARLFAEGEAEERGRRFQKLRELRQANKARYEAWRPPPSRDPAELALSWMALSRALFLTEELIAVGAEFPLWNAFCNSELFFHVKNYPDFVFSLEALLKERPEFPEAGRRAFFRAYEFDRKPVEKEYAPLYRLLSGGHAPPTRRKRNPRATIPTPVELFAAVAILLSLFGMAVWMGRSVRSIRSKQAERVRQWMEEDYGREFVRVKNGGGWSDEKSFLFFDPQPFLFLDAQAGIYFRARRQGARDTENGRRGYVSNYADVRISREIAAFSDRWECSVYPYAGEGEAMADLQGMSYYLYFPVTGGGDAISALGDMLSAVQAADWRPAEPPQYDLHLCWRNWSFYHYDASKEAFPAAALRDYYERSFGPDLCKIALEQTGVAAEDMGEGSFYLWPESGVATIENRLFFHVIGARKTPPVRELYDYFLSEDCAELFRVSAGRDPSTLTLRDLYGMDKTSYDVKGFGELTVFRSKKAR